VLAGVGPKTIEKIEAAGIASLEKLAGMTPEQLMEIPGIGEKMVDKIYQAVNRFYEGGEAPPAGEVADITDETAEEAPATEAAAESEAAPAETAPATESSEPEPEPEPEQTAAAETSSETQGSAEQKEEANS
jgi:N utilization substance protein A